MRKIIVLLLAIICFITTAEAQTVVVQNNETASAQIQDPNIFYINGIPSTQDIGGVDTRIEYITHDYCPRDNYVIFKNYHSYTVTVLYEVIFNEFNSLGEVKKTGTVVLEPNGLTSILISSRNGRTVIYNIATIVRKL